MPPRPRPPLLLLAAVLATCVAGCGGGEDSTAASTDPSTTTSVPAPRTPGPVADAQVIAILSGTGAGGAVGTTATDLHDPQAVGGLMAGLRGTLVRQVATAVAGGSKDGPELYGQVVSVGCDVPSSVSVTTDGADFTLVPAKAASPRQECFAAVTTVAIVRIPPLS